MSKNRTPYYNRFKIKEYLNSTLSILKPLELPSSKFGFLNDNLRPNQAFNVDISRREHGKSLQKGLQWFLYSI